MVRTSSFCSEGSCVGVAIGADEVRVVDTKTDGALSFTAAEWAAFVAGVKAGEFDLHQQDPDAWSERSAERDIRSTNRDPAPPTRLR